MRAWAVWFLAAATMGCTATGPFAPAGNFAGRTVPPPTTGAVGGYPAYAQAAGAPEAYANAAASALQPPNVTFDPGWRPSPSGVASTAGPTAASAPQNPTFNAQSAPSTTFGGMPVNDATAMARNEPRPFPNFGGGVPLSNLQPPVIDFNAAAQAATNFGNRVASAFGANNTGNAGSSGATFGAGNTGTTSPAGSVSPSFRPPTIRRDALASPNAGFSPYQR